MIKKIKHFFQNLDDGHQITNLPNGKVFVLCNQEEIPIRFRVMLKGFPI